MPRRNRRKKNEYRKRKYVSKKEWRALDAIENMRAREPAASTGRLTKELPNPKRGEVWFVDFGDYDNSSIQRGRRPAVIISIDVSNERSGTVTAIPFTSKIKKTWYPSHIPIADEDMETVEKIERVGRIEPASAAESAITAEFLETSHTAAKKRKVIVPSLVLTEQVRVIDKRDLLNCIGRVSQGKLSEIERGLSGWLGLD